MNICNNYQQHLCTVYVYVYSERSMVEEKRQDICFLVLQTRHSSVMVIMMRGAQLICAMDKPLCLLCSRVFEQNVFAFVKKDFVAPMSSMM